MEIVFSEDGRDFVRRDWSNLVTADPSGTFFHTPQFLKLYWEEFVPGQEGLLLVDANGLRLGGHLADEPSDPAGDRVAAQLAGVSREAARATRLLGLGAWHTISVESPDGHVVLTPASADTVVVAAREPSLPMGRVALLAERAARSARGWLEEQA